jgi:solute carrier family 13 (sodium-dependent dicarboxylate transporter), member 2/3/5
MQESKKGNRGDPQPRILLVDDEDAFRFSLKKQLAVRGYDVLDVSNGEDALKAVRHESPEVVVLDQKMPKFDGIQTLKEIKKIRPEVQVIMLTGYGSIESARETGKHDVFHYLQKPCALEDLIDYIEAARRERVYSMARHEIPALQRASLRKWLIGSHNARPGVILLGALLFAAFYFMPAPDRLMSFVTEKKSDPKKDLIVGYSEYGKMKAGQTIAQYYSDKAGLYRMVQDAEGKEVKELLGPEETAKRARVMVGILVVSALFWATGGIPVGMTALLVGVLMYFFGVLPPDKVAQAYAKDSVIFIFGVLALASAISKTGLDRRIGMLLLGTSTSIPKLLFIFTPMLSVTASFLSEHALTAFIAPILLMVYAAGLRSAGVAKDRTLAVVLFMTLTFAANVGGPGSPAAGGRNAVMIGILSDYGIQISFAQWVKMGLPFVPVAALAIGLYFYLISRRGLKAKGLNIAAEVMRESKKIGKMTQTEYRTAAVLVLLVVLWSTVSDRFGMGGPVILALVALNILGILRWKDVNSIHWDVVALYAAASAIGGGLAATGGALWMADAFVGALPDFMKRAEGLCMATSLISGVITNFMSDGATVAAIGPITVPMATLSGTSPIAVGLATAFASSFANMLIIGTPNNAIVYSIAKDPETGEQLVTMKDFLIHGAVVLVLNFAVLWFWVIFGYWRWLGV